jgi:hypothetical protein
MAWSKINRMSSENRTMNFDHKERKTRRVFNHGWTRIQLTRPLAATKVAQTSPPSPLAPARSRRSEAETDKSAVSRVSQPASPTTAEALPIWKSATQQVWKPALQQDIVFIRIQKFAAINKTFMDRITKNTK